MRLPTAKTLQRIKGMEVEQARKLRAVLEEHFGQAPRPTYDKVHAALMAADRIIGGHGVEYIRHKKDADDFTRAYGLDYVNLGDTYDCTLVFNWLTQTWYVSSWGDIVERNMNAYL